MTQGEQAVEGARRRGLPPAVGLVFWLVVLPLTLIGLGLWQLDRSSATRVEVEEAGVNIAQSLAEIRAIAADDPNAGIRFEGGQSYSASLAASMFEEAADDNDMLQKLAAVRHPLAYLTVAGGALALFGGGLGLLLSEIAGRRARRSRDQLLRSFSRLRLALPFLLGAVMLGLAFAGLGATLFETLTLPFWGEISGNAIKLGLAGILLAGLALFCAITAVRGLRRVFALLEPEPIVEHARVVTPDDAPGLWQFVRLVAGRVEAELPDTLVIGLTSGFYVTESPVRLLPENMVIEGRTLHVPAPMLELLDTAEIAAIVGHELAHFAGEDTAFSQRFVPIYSSLQRSLGALHQADLRGDFGIGASLRLGYHALSRFDAAVGHWSRLREFEADRRGCLASTPAGAASALVRSHVADAAVHAVLGAAFEGRGDGGPDLVSAMRALAREKGFPDPDEHLEDRQPHPTDSHPPTIQRIQALGVEADEALLAQATRRPEDGHPSFGRRAFKDWDSFCRALSVEFLSNAEVVRTEIREELEAAAAGVGEEDVVLFENAGPLATTMVVIGCGFAVAIGCVYLFPLQMGFGYDETGKAILAAILAVGVVLSFAASWYFRRRANRPLMVLTPETLASHWLAEPLHWHDVDWYQVHVAQRLALQLGINERASLPVRARFSFYNKVKPKRRIVELDAMGIRGMKPDAFSDLVGRYLAAAHARRALAARSD
ncbi:M48 family metalloprotease [Aureimonas psammosilenae]|uniref:M48 family metalloprotease n=1 Tax=Aureimonas psammosilenae TaxID=2495496 RepID=UPI001261210E|nr:M48 family metallopeptidase [Aureimonas psammosilenae]